MTDALFYALTAIAVWFIWLWITQDKYEDGVYVPVMARVLKIFKRVVCRRAAVGS